MSDFFSIKKTGNATLWFLVILGLPIGLFAIMEGNTGPGIFWIGLGAVAIYMLWQRKSKKPENQEK